MLHFADLSLDTGTRQAFRGERAIDLTARNIDLLELFMRHPRQVLTREVIFDRVWGYNFGGESNIIEVYVRYLRQKTEAKRRDAPGAHGARRWLRISARKRRSHTPLRPFHIGLNSGSKWPHANCLPTELVAAW